MIIFYLVIFIIGLLTGYFYSKHKNAIIQKEIDTEVQQKQQQQIDELNTEIQNLILSKQYTQEHLRDMKSQADIAADIFYQQRMELATNRIEQDIDALEERYNEAMNTLEHHYSEAKEQYKINYLDTLNDLQASYADIVASKQEEVCKINYEILEAKDMLTELRDKASAATASNKLAAMSKDEKDFYRCVISDQSVNEVSQLRKIEPYLHDTRPLCKVIWESYYRDSCSALLDRLVGSERISGIYKITNLDDNRTYVGQAVNIADRLKTHIKAGIGIDPTNNKMYVDMKKLGVENFSFEIVEKCPATKLNEREKYWINFYDCQEFGYNLTKGGS